MLFAETFFHKYFQKLWFLIKIFKKITFFKCKHILKIYFGIKYSIKKYITWNKEFNEKYNFDEMPFSHYDLTVCAK